MFNDLFLTEIITMAPPKVSLNDVRNGRIVKTSSTSFNDRIALARRVLHDNKKEKDSEAKARPMNVYKSEIRAQIEAAQHAFLSHEAKKVAIDAYKMEVRHEVITGLKHDLRDSVIVEMNEELRPEVIRNLQRQHEIRVISEMRDELRGKVIESMKRDLYSDVIELLKAENFEKVTANIDSEIRPGLKVLIKGQLEEDLYPKMEASVREEIRTKRRNKIEDEIQEDLEREIRQDMKARYELMIAAELQTERDELRLELREQVKEEIRDELANQIRGEMQAQLELQIEAEIRAKKDEMRARMEREVELEIRTELYPRTESELKADTEPKIEGGKVENGSPVREDDIMEDEHLYIPSLPTINPFLSRIACSEILTVDSSNENISIIESMLAHISNTSPRSSPPQSLKRSYHSSFASEVDDNTDHTHPTSSKRQRGDSHDSKVEHTCMQQPSICMTTHINEDLAYDNLSESEEEYEPDDVSSIAGPTHSSNEYSESSVQGMAPFGTYAKYGEEDFANRRGGEDEDENNADHEDNADDEEDEDVKDDMEGSKKNSDDDDDDDDAEEPMHYYHAGFVQEDGAEDVDVENYNSQDDEEEDEDENEDEEEDDEDDEEQELRYERDILLQRYHELATGSRSIFDIPGQQEEDGEDEHEMRGASKDTAIDLGDSD